MKRANKIRTILLLSTDLELTNSKISNNCKVNSINRDSLPYASVEITIDSEIINNCSSFIETINEEQSLSFLSTKESTNPDKPYETLEENCKIRKKTISKHKKDLNKSQSKIELSASVHQQKRKAALVALKALKKIAHSLKRTTPRSPRLRKTSRRAYTHVTSMHFNEIDAMTDASCVEIDFEAQSKKAKVSFNTVNLKRKGTTKTAYECHSHLTDIQEVRLFKTHSHYSSMKKPKMIYENLNLKLDRYNKDINQLQEDHMISVLNQALL